MRTIALVLLLLAAGCTQVQVHDRERVRFAVVILEPDYNDRVEIEDRLSEHLRANGFGALASNRLVSRQFRINDPAFRNRLLKQQVSVVLALRPIETGPGASIKSAEKYVPRDAYTTIREFVAGYRGEDFTTQAVIEIGGFRLLPDRAAKIWHGVLWLDGEAVDRGEALDQLSGLVLEHMRQWRNQMRKSAGLPPLKE